jgi:hypothetical protein
MKVNTGKIASLSFFLVILLLNHPVCYAQKSQDEYLKSNPDKKEFNQEKWNSLKGKLKKESSGGSGNGEINFEPKDFTNEKAPEGDFYDYDKEDAKGEYSEYQNFENEDYEYVEEYDNYEYQENTYNSKPDKEETYSNIKKPKKPTEPKKPKKSKQRNSDSSSGDGVYKVLEIIAYIVVGGLIIFLVYYFFLHFKGSDSGAKIEVNFDETPPSEIPKSELERRLEAALANEDYREAIRIYFIFIIKDLATKDWIKWEREKTNYSYLMEMRSKPQFELFNEVVSVYDVVWYGNYTISKSLYETVEPKFKQLLKEINN